MVHQSAAASSMEASQGQGQAVEERNALALVPVAAGGGGGGAAGGKEPSGLSCPRCLSTDTKFCYYNNYNLGQPRHFCKACRRYWTRGGALRNVPVGGGTRKAAPAGRRKRASSSSSSTASASATTALLTASPTPLSMSAPNAYYATAPASPAPPLSMSASGYATLRTYDHLHHLSPFMPTLASPLTAVDPDRRLLDLGGSFTSLLAPAPDGRFSAAGSFFMGGLPAVMSPPASSSAPALLPPPHQPVSQALPEGLIWGMGWPDLSI